MSDGQKPRDGTESLDPPIRSCVFCHWGGGVWDSPGRISPIRAKFPDELFSTPETGTRISPK